MNYRKTNKPRGIVSRLTVWLLLAAAVLALPGCGGEKQAQTEEKKLKIVATVFPEYDWVNAVLGERADEADVTLLLDSGVDLHSFQPSADDLITVAGCDLFLYIGGESDGWVEDALKTAGNGERRVICCMQTLADAVVEEETVEGMEAEEEEEGEDGEEAPEMDEHIWLSLRNAEKLVSQIAETLGALDAEGKDIYAANAKAYCEKLSDLDRRYAETVENGVRDTLLFADRFSFRYLTEDYGLSYYAAFSGCSAESEASFETVLFLAKKTDELSLPCVMVIEGSDGKIAQTVIENTAEKNQKILTLNSMQSVTSQDVADGVSYLGIMESNLTVLSEALG